MTIASGHTVTTSGTTAKTINSLTIDGTLTHTANPSTTVSSTIWVGDTTLNVASAATFPSSGTLIVDDEQITYTGTTGTTFTGCTRAANGTSQIIHGGGVGIALMTLYNEVKIQAGSVVISATGKIDVDGQGYKGGQTCNQSGTGPGGGKLINGSQPGGGGHGGAGGKPADGSAAGGVAYDDAAAPVNHGSGGANGCISGSTDGGGTVELVITGTGDALTLASGGERITADGEAGASSYANAQGGGAGGSVYINMSGGGNVTGTGSISAIGAAGGTTTWGDGGAAGGGGGGGRISIINYGSLSSVTLTVTGGTASGTATAGAAGTTNQTQGNQAPSAPSALGGVSYVDGSTGYDFTPTLSFTTDDPEDDQVKFQILIDDSSDFASPVVEYTSALAAEGSTSFTVGQAAGGGTYSTGSEGQSLSAASYYWKVRAIDASAAVSSYSTANGGAVAFAVALPSLTINDVALAEGNAGSSNATFTVTLSAVSGQAATVDYATSNGTATGGTDYTIVSGSLSFAAGETTKTFNVPILGDTLDEVDETYTATLSNAANATIADATGAGTITDDDATPTIAFTATTGSGGEGTTPGNMELTLSAVSGRDVTVDYTVSGGTATGSGTDYTLANGTATITAGSTTTNIGATIVNDALDETDETIEVTIANPGNATLGANTIHTYTITDNDATPTVAVTDVSVDEAAGTATVTVTMTGYSGASVTVDYATSNGTATAVADYTSASGTLTWTTGQTGDKTYTVTIANDALDEADETITNTLSNAANASISDATGTATITDNDATPTIAFTATTGSGGEGTTPGNMELTLSAVSGRDVTVDYAVSGGTATGSGTDYTLASGTATIAAGSTTTNIGATIVNDALDETDETIEVTIANPGNATLGANTIHTYTITDNDATPTVAVADVSVDESAGTATVTVTMTGYSASSVTVDYATSNGTATAVADYTATNGTLTWTTGQTGDKTYAVTIANDALDEADETITNTLSNAANATLSDSTGVATITDNDATPTIAFSASSSSGAESATPATITIALSAVSERDVTVDYALSGTATGSGTDYTLANGTATITAGNTSTNVSATVVDDALAEGDETMILTLSNPSNATLGTTAGHTYTITDDDTAALTVTESGGATNVTEGGVTDTITIVLGSQPTADVTVAVSGGSQLSSDQTNLTFGAGNWNVPQTLTVTAVNDSVAEGNHTQTLSVTTTSNDVGYNSFSSSKTINITDNESAGISVAESGGSTNATEAGGTDSYTVVLTSQPTADVVITPTSGDADYGVTVSPSSVTFTSVDWNVPQTITVTAVNDARVEGNHTATISHVAVSSDTNYHGIGINGVTVAITDNDSAGVTVAESGGSTTVAEAGAADNYTIVLASQPVANVTVTLTAGVGASVSPSSLTFTVANWNVAQSVGVTATDDSVVNGTRSATITHAVTSADVGYQGIAAANVSVSITDNDTEPPSDEGATETESDTEACTPLGARADAGSDQTVAVGESITLDGSGSTASAYLWDADSGTLSNATTVSPGYTAPDSAQDVVVTVTVTDCEEASSSDTVIIHVVHATLQSQDSLVMGVVGGSLIEAWRCQDGRACLALALGTVMLPTECPDYNVMITADERMILGMPCEAADRGGVYVVARASEVTGVVDLQPTSGQVLAGEDEGDRLGASVAHGDLDDDGVEEVVVAAPGAGSYGKVFVLNAHNQVVWEILGSEAYPIASIHIADLIGSPGDDLVLSSGHATAAERRFIIAGENVTGGNMDLSSEPPDFDFDGGVQAATEATGDLNCDGADDVALAGTLQGGAIYFGPLAGTGSGAADADVVIASEDSDFGETAAVGDVSGDGCGDLVIGSPAEAGGSGAIYVVFGRSVWEGSIALSASSQVVKVVGDAGQALGESLLLLDDDADGDLEIYTTTSVGKSVRVNLRGLNNGEDTSAGETMADGPGRASSFGGRANAFGCSLIP
ncbi:MAG: FG-GAP repeat protein [Deltaproteobacteria bacterium]|nr:FG-GAP repeat protein [Deltaproteobacteria bacterium]